MIEITLNAFSFLRAKLKRDAIAHLDAKVSIPAGSSVHQLIARLGLVPGDVEAAFVNNHIVSLDTVLGHNDRVALVPPGTPGPYRVMLGMVEMEKSENAPDDAER